MLEGVYQTLEAASGYALDHDHVNLSGLCPSCRATATQDTRRQACSTEVLDSESLAAVLRCLAGVAWYHGHAHPGWIPELRAHPLIMFLLVLPFWAVGIRRIRQTMTARNVPLIALMAAFSFVIMMFNVPLPGGTTGHAVGAALAAIMLGPEAATIAISIALIIQALFFGDGGILAIGANCFNMAVVIPYIAAAVYHAVSKDSPLDSSRRLVGAAVGGWMGVTVAAFLAGVEFGIQPLLFRAADGTPLYAPYPLSVSIPAMVIPHALVASVVEGLLTALVVAYLQRSNSAVLEAAEKPATAAHAASFAKLRWLWAGLIALVIISPLGLLAPGTAWGEWGAEATPPMGTAIDPGRPGALVEFVGRAPRRLRCTSSWEMPILVMSSPRSWELPSLPS